MAKRRTDKEIAAILQAIERQRARGVQVADCCKAQGVAEQSYYRWRADRAAGRDDTARQLRELRAEVDRLKNALAETVLDNRMLREVAKKVVTGEQRRAAVGWLVGR